MLGLEPKLLYIGVVNDCLQEADLLELTREPLQAFEQRVAAIPADLCAPFHDEARTLETELLGVYRVVVLCTKREDDISKVSQWWDRMVAVCDAFGNRLNRLANEHPNCGAGYYYDRVLDLRNKCQRLANLHK